MLMTAIGVFCTGCADCSNQSPEENLPDKCVIVVPSGATFLENRAAEELAEYMARITGRKTTVTADSKVDLADGKTFFIVGPPKRNSFAAKLLSEGLLSSASEMPEHEDAFVVLSDKAANGAAVILLAGRKPLGSLYAVYDYLETYCGVGFFQDGEHVPQMAQVPRDNLRRVERPRFDNRLHFCWNGHEAIKKYHSYWWSLDEWKREFDWMAKRRLNMIRIDLGYYTHFAGDAFEQAFPEIGPEVQQNGYFALAGFPHDWNWPPEYRREMLKKAMEYGRSLGIRFIYRMDYASVPQRFIKAHPEIKYMPADVYGPSRQIDPRDPNAAKIEKQYLQTIVKIFGTDNLYMYTPYVEIDVGGGSPEKNLEVRVAAANGILKLIRDVDPEGMWVTDTWDMIFRQRWNPKIIKTYLDSFPDDKLYLYNTSADVETPPLSKENDWWYGKKWAFGVLNAYAGEDFLRGDPVELIGRVKEASRQANCTGVFLIPEMTHYNIMFWDMVTHLAWDPSDVDYEKYLRGYCVRRYGSEFEAPTVEVWRKVTQAVLQYKPYRGEQFMINRMYVNYPWYRLLCRQMGNHVSAPMFDENKAIFDEQVEDLHEEIPLLQEALTEFMKLSDAQKDNDVYVEDAVVLLRTYASKCFNWETACAFKAFKAGDKKAFKTHRGRAMEILGIIRDVLALCPTYSANKTIAEASSVPGSNKFIPNMVRQACINWNYVMNDVYEQFDGQYIPRMKAYFNTLESQMERKVNTVSYANVAPLFPPIDNNYRDNGWSPEQPASGDPVDAVAAALEMPCLKACLVSIKTKVESNLKEKETTVRLIQQTPNCFDFDVVLAGEDSPAFRILLPEKIHATGMDSLLGTHMVPGKWSEKDGVMRGTVDFGKAIKLDVEIKKGKTEITAKFKLTNMLDRDITNVYVDVCTSLNHLPGAPGWCNRTFMGNLPLDRAIQGRTWFEKISPKNLFAITDKGWVPMHPNPDKPDANSVPLYSFVSSKTANAIACVAQSPDKKTWFYQAWSVPCRYMTPCPGNACMHLEPVVAEKIPAGGSAEIRVIAGMHTGSKESLVDKIKQFRKAGK